MRPTLDKALEKLLQSSEFLDEAYKSMSQFLQTIDWRDGDNHRDFSPKYGYFKFLLPLGKSHFFMCVEYGYRVISKLINSGGTILKPGDRSYAVLNEEGCSSLD